MGISTVLVADPPAHKVRGSGPPIGRLFSGGGPLAGKFTGRVLVLGGGSVSQCAVPLLLRHIVASPSQLTVMDFQDVSDRFAEPIAAGINFVISKVTQDNLDQVLAEQLSAGDVLVDLAWNIEAGVIIDWCHSHCVLYLNTSVEEWDPYDAAGDRDPRARTLWHRHAKLQQLKADWASTGPTASPGTRTAITSGRAWSCTSPSTPGRC